MFPPEGQQLWELIHDTSKTWTEQNIRDRAKALGYRRKDYTKGDFKCMWWKNAFSVLVKMKRTQPKLCPDEVVDWLWETSEKACAPDDSDPNGPTGRGYKTFMSATLGDGWQRSELGVDAQAARPNQVEVGKAVAALLVVGEVAAALAAAAASFPLWGT
ncbi:MAG TPA: hypothetical protein VFZ09_01245 [Archangium sp.]|uniref:hypothetical protein n=1 Tax=Archangium sp. TaxID=1872627 RepID=UPI002E362131|nr:hypothetical protein [Archangium sp.]HEX5744834.1 hypothetical protein [Archangium sp.]